MEDLITVSIHGISKDSTQIFYSIGHVQVWRKRVVVVRERVFLKGKRVEGGNVGHSRSKRR